MPPIQQAFVDAWPQVTRTNLLDDALSSDLAAAGVMNEAMLTRISNLAQYARSTGAAGILFTCSSFGPAIDAAKRTLNIPVLKPNEAMFDEALALCAQKIGPSRIGLVTTFAPATALMKMELEAEAKALGVDAMVEVVYAEGALAALSGGDPTTHDSLVLNAARTLSHCEVILLAQFSMARAQSMVASSINKPVLSSPQSAVRKLKAALHNFNPS